MAEHTGMTKFVPTGSPSGATWVAGYVAESGTLPPLPDYGEAALNKGRLLKLEGLMKSIRKAQDAEDVAWKTLANAFAVQGYDVKAGDKYAAKKMAAVITRLYYPSRSGGIA